ncbi:uncharacterized protein PV07_00251 [Cladophialophora immunda]|uniref:Uncharacterized protein n=1 Tax=Cladophialophora immunda TaxID=569365 RepID=A0A0D2CQB1_9EURO|nr:uncharacterized protein PV07_00251 [Cladophialophora immunda]KIW33398.1 hypothetical protein PV07_00251 [Cladophialophora immunda]
MAFSTNPSDKLPLTFGVEIEYVFGVNKDVVCSNPVYHWLFPQNCSLYPNSANPANFDPTLDAHKGLLQAVKILRSKGARLGVIVHQGSQEESFDLYSQWHMSTDSSVRFPANAYDLERFSGGRIREWRGWEFSGLELISPALPVPEFDLHHFHPYGLAEVQTYLGFMTQPRPEGTPYFFLSGPEAAGVHVHIGLQPQPDGQTDLPLGLLRHLAFICLAFEDTITLLHHPQRHSYPASYSRRHIGTNRFVGSLPHTFPRHHCKEGPGFSLEDAFLRIFRAKTSHELVELLTTIPAENKGNYRYMVRECFVNFTNCFEFIHTGEKRTVEFRQHHGTLAIKDIAHWVVFLTALARTAERKANEEPRPNPTLPPSLAPKILSASLGTQVEPLKTGVLDTPIDALWQDTASHLESLTTIIREASKYPDLFQTGKKRTLKELFDLLQLPRVYRQYWWERAKQFRAEWAAGWRGTGTCEGQLPCRNDDVRDNEGWAHGELDVPPWDVDEAGASTGGDGPASSGRPPFAQLCILANQLIDLEPWDFAAVMQSEGWPDGPFYGASSDVNTARTGAAATAAAGAGQFANQSTDVDMTDDDLPTTTTGVGPSSSPHSSRANVMSISAITN